MAGETRDLTSLAFETLPLAVLIVDGDGKVLSRNAAAEAMLPAGDQIGAALAVQPEASFVWAQEFASLAEAPKGLTRRNLPLAGKGSRRLLVDLHISLLPQAGRGAPKAALVVAQDVSGRAAMERRLAASERLAAVGDLAGKVGHELNNPLDGVLRYMGLAERACGDEAAEYIAKARAGLGRMAELIKGLTEEATCTSPGGRLQAIDKLLDEAITVMNPRAQALGVSVVCDIADEGRVRTPGSVFQVFCNVIKNALDAMPNGGVLKIRLRRDGRRCVTEFTDTGCGLADEHAEAIFQPFFSTKHPGEGTGLGLAICRETLARLGGSITAANRDEGGAVVTVDVPLVERPAGRAENSK